MADYPLEAGGERGAAGGRRQGEHQQRIGSGIVLKELAGWSENTRSVYRAGGGSGRACAEATPSLLQVISHLLL